MTIYVPGTEEKDPTKVIMSIQQVATSASTATTNIATNTANIATNTTNIATNASAIAVLQALLASATNTLSADVALNNVANFFDGPSMAQGTTGTWFVSGHVTLQDTAGAATMSCQLWDGTTVITSAVASVAAASGRVVVALAGILASPAANIRISCKDATSTSGKILFNNSGLSKDSSIFGIRIA